MTQHIASEPGSPSLTSRPDDSCVLHIDKLCFGYSGQPIFGELSASIPQGVTLVKGGDGRGKTSLLRLLAGELLPDSGDLQIGACNSKNQASAYRQQVFRCDTQTDAFDQHTVSAYLALQCSKWPAFDQQLLTQAIKGLALAEHLHKNIFMLSTGSKRKVWLAAAFAAGAAVTLLDEPFSALDAPSIRFVLERLQEANFNSKPGQDSQSPRAWVLADYQAPDVVALASVLDLGD